LKHDNKLITFEAQRLENTKKLMIASEELETKTENGEKAFMSKRAKKRMEK
jgi:hypothetical protein